jgi:hypothetical protein
MPEIQALNYEPQAEAILAAKAKAANGGQIPGGQTAAVAAPAVDAVQGNDDIPF